jgi:hypothetical protein
MEGITKEELMELFVTESAAMKKPKKKRDLSEEQRKTMLERLALMREKAAEKRGVKKAEVKEEVKAKTEPESVLEPRAEPTVDIKAEAAVGLKQSYDKTVHEKILSQLTELNQHTKSLAELKREKRQPKQAEAPVLKRPLSPPPQTAQVKPTHFAAPPPKTEPVYVAPPPPQHVEPQYIMPNRNMIKKRGIY